MLSDYRAYLLNIRNNLIKCGVDLEVKDISSYEEVFYFGEMLSDLLWFYSVLSIGGSDDRLRGFLFPINHINNDTEELEDDEFISYVVLEEVNDTNELEEVNNTNELEDDDTEELEDDEFISYSIFTEGIVSKDEDYSVIPQKGEELEDGDYFIEYGIEDITEITSEVLDSEEVINEVTPRKGEELEDGDYFIEYGILEEDNYNEDEEEYEDEFSSWGDTDEDEDLNLIVEEYEDEFPNWGNTEECIEEDNEDTFESWGSSDEEEYEDEDLEDEDTFESWGNTDEGEDEYNDTDEDFPSWGSSDEEEYFESEDDYGDEDTFGSWGSDDDEEPIEDEGTFSSWGSDDDEDSFSSWGSSDENDEEYEYEEDTFGNWGSSEENSSDSEDLDRSDFGSWGQSQYSSNTINNTTPNGDMSSEMKSKLDYEIESNEKTAMIIEKIATGIFSKGNLFKTKVSEKIKNLGDTQE